MASFLSVIPPFLLSVLIFSGAVVARGDVLELGDADFDYLAAEHETMLVKFYAPWWEKIQMKHYLMSIHCNFYTCNVILGKYVMIVTYRLGNWYVTLVSHQLMLASYSSYILSIGHHLPNCWQLACSWPYLQTVFEQWPWVKSLGSRAPPKLQPVGTIAFVCSINLVSEVYKAYCM